MVRKNLFISNFKNIPKAFILFLLFFIATEFFISIFFSMYANNFTNAKIKAEIRITRRAEFKYDILVFGDSSATQAIDTSKLEKYTGLSAFNFGMIGDITLVGDYFLLKKYLASGKTSRYVVLMNVYDIWHRECSTQLLMINFFEDFTRMMFNSEIFNMWHGDIIKEMATYILPSQRYRYEIKNIKNTRINISELEQNLLRTRGHSDEIGTNEKGIIRDMLEHKEMVGSNIFTVSRTNLYYFDKFLKTCEQNNIKILFCFPPILKEFYDQEIKNNYLRSYKSFIKNKTSHYVNIIFVNDDFYIVPIENLSSSIDHLNEKGSAAFTKILAKKIMLSEF